MSRSVNVQIMTAHDDTDDALRSVITHLKSAGYEFVDYTVLSSAEEPVEVPISTSTHALLAVLEPEHEQFHMLPLPNASEDPTL